MNIKSLISDRVHQALIVLGAPFDGNVQVCQSTKSKFGDYQVNSVMSVAKKISISPRQLAEQVLRFLSLDDIARKVEIAGPGFINIFLKRTWLASRIDLALNSKKLGITVVQPQTIIIDYSAPNVAKEMHVGHLRSTIIGDASARTLEFLGHNVIRANHVGDWGTQFGMLIAYLEKIQNENADNIGLSDLERYYRQAKKQYDENEKFASRARSYVVKLQGGDLYCKKVWNKLVSITMRQNQLIYNLLNVTLTEGDVMGESIYNVMLPKIIDDLKTKGIAMESEGAIVVYLDEFKNKAGKPMGVIIQKKDGGYLYATTDIACAKYRYEILGANRMLYYTDSRQHQHLLQVWAIVRKAGYVPDTLPLEHHWFGMILGKDGKPFKTRTGETVKLSNLLDEAIQRAYKLITKKKSNIPIEEMTQVARIIGIGALKYADLSKNRTTDYVFDWDKILAFEGNTALYMQYAYTRIVSIFKRAGIDAVNLTLPLVINEEYEIALALRLLQFEEAITTVACEGTPHVMCKYLYDLAGLFSKFYENCQIINANSEIIRQSRLKLALLTSRTIKTGLYTLGIETIEVM